MRAVIFNSKNDQNKNVLLEFENTQNIGLRQGRDS